MYKQREDYSVRNFELCIKDLARNTRQIAWPMKLECSKPTRLKITMHSRLKSVLDRVGH